MYIDIKRFTGAINKITDLVSEDKTIPGILLRLSRVEDSETDGILQVAYSDALTKATIEELPVNIEPTDFIGDVATYYEQMVSAINSCQPFGKIEVDTLRIEYFPETLKLSVEQIISYPDSTGEGLIRAKRGVKYIDISRVDPTSTPKTKVLITQQYDKIFDCEQTDEYDRDMFIQLLSRTSTEKGKLTYISPIKQQFLVANNAYAVTCDIPKYDVSEAEVQQIREQLQANGITDDESFNKIYEERQNRAHHSIVISQQLAKSIINMLSKVKSDKIYLEKVDAFCNIFVDNDEEKFGIWFKIPQGTGVHINFVDRHTALGYTTYQMTFLKDLFQNAVSQALTTTKSEKVELKFNAVENSEDNKVEYEVSINGGSASASTSNMSKFKAEDVVDTLGDLSSRSLNISLKVLDDMIKQLKTDLIAFDVDISTDDKVCIRLAEIDIEKRAAQYQIMRMGLDDNTPTPIESKLEARNETLIVKEYTTLK